MDRTTPECCPLTEVYYCPLSGSDHGDTWKYTWRGDNKPCEHSIRMPGRILPPETTDEQAEHERAMERALSWSRSADGRVFLWVER